MHSCTGKARPRNGAVDAIAAGTMPPSFRSGFTLALLVAVSAVACHPSAAPPAEVSGSPAGSDAALGCEVLVDVYCKTAAAPECANRNYQNALFFWNAAATAAPLPSDKAWGCGQCEGYDVLEEEEISSGSKSTRYFARSDGALAAIVSRPGRDASPRCLAGPAAFSVPACQPGGRCGGGVDPGAAPRDN
jgi:hypothetical protein